MNVLYIIQTEVAVTYYLLFCRLTINICCLFLNIGHCHYCVHIFCRHPISSMVFGTNALITKPAFSLSPMFAVSILNSYGYNELKDKTNVATPELKQVMFTLICWYPIIVGIIQFTSWSFYRVRSNKDEINL